MIPYQKIKKYIDKKLVAEQKHPENPNIRIFNYTQECQFSKQWDEVTQQCRGLVMDIETGEIIARPFPKFFNYQEHIAQGKSIPNEIPIVTDKLDGSLGIMYKLNGKIQFATRGSFTSDQALWATKWWNENHSDFVLEDGITHLFEIIYPENRIVVNYDFSGLVYLASIEISSGNTIFNQDIPTRKANIIPASDLETLSKMDLPNSEGFVCYYPNENLRLKVKFPEYVRLHKLVTGVSEIAIWEYLIDGKSLGELLEKVPDEFFNWVTKVQFRLMKEYAEILTRCKNDFDSIAQAGRTRKDIALNFQNDCKYPSVLFAMLDGKDYSQAIWKMVRPKGQSQFKKDIDL